MFKIVALGLICTSASAASGVAISVVHDVSRTTTATAQTADVSLDTGAFVIPSYVSSMSIDQVEPETSTDVVTAAVPTVEQMPLSPALFVPAEITVAKAPDAAPAELVQAPVNVSFGTRTMGASLAQTITPNLDYTIGVYR